MSAKIIDGKTHAANIRAFIKTQIDELPSDAKKPGLLVITIGDDSASKVYVNNKRKACEEVGMRFRQLKVPSLLITTWREQSLAIQAFYDELDKVQEEFQPDGIILQLPAECPSFVIDDVINKIGDKDVDGFADDVSLKLYKGHSKDYEDFGRLPCTPSGIIYLLEAENVPIGCKNVVVVGRSNIVGKPVAMMLLGKNATVTICHSKTVNLKEHLLGADIVISAVGKAKFITADMIKPGATVIDVGMNRDENGKLCGDIDFEKVKEIAGAITPVPGGVGPMTVAMLLSNTWVAYYNHYILKD